MDVDVLFEENKNKEGVWCNFDENVAFKITPLLQSEMGKLIEDCSKEIMKNGKVSNDFDDKKFTVLCNAAIVVDWKGINKDGKPWKCNGKNATLLVQNSETLKNFIDDQIELIKAQRLQKALDASKN